MTIVLLALGLVALLVAVAGWSLGCYNRLVRAKHEVANAGGQIQVHLQSRHDLVPALVECVRGYAIHERDIIQNVADALSRTLSCQGLTAETIARENVLSAALMGLQRVISIGYPNLKADAGFVNLSNRLVEVEEKIARSRQYYNDAVYRFASEMRAFPGVLFASQVHLGELPPYFQAAETADKAPQFSFSGASQS